MKRTVDTKHEVVFEANGYTVVRSEVRNQDRFTEEISGRIKVFYDVCDEDGDLLESFKTLREAKRFCEE